LAIVQAAGRQQPRSRLDFKLQLDGSKRDASGLRNAGAGLVDNGLDRHCGRGQGLLRGCELCPASSMNITPWCFPSDHITRAQKF
jgi:hypothetical protein